MSEFDWTTVLNHLYENNGVFLAEADINDPPEEYDQMVQEEQRTYLREQLIEKLNLSTSDSDEVRKLLLSLERTNLLEERVRNEWAEISLTPKGFEVAHERELNERQIKINRNLALFTFVLVVVGLLQVLVDIIPRGPTLTIGVSAILAVVVVIFQFID